MSALAVDCRNLTRRFGEFVAVNDVSFAIERGSIFGFLGPNGAGKSTTIRMLLGILPPSQGEGTVLGHNLVTESEAIRSRVGYMSQKFSLYEDLTVVENLRFFGGIFGLSDAELAPRLEELLDLARLRGYESQLAFNLPGGIRQRLALAASLIHDPELIFLDEPTGSVDPALRRYFWERIADLSHAGKTVMVTSHYMDEVERCHEICFINRGQLIARGTPHQLKEQHLHGSMWQVETSRRLETVKLLKPQPGVANAFVSGLGVRFRLTSGHPIEPIRELLDEEVSSADPTLEDVFVSLVTEESPS